jgi:tyrosyl-tRNA synthetase
MEGIKKQLSRFIDFSSPKKGIMVNNADWLAPLMYLPLLREIGPHFSVNRMLTADCFKQRMEKGLSFLEFNYMILQSYDFLHLFRSEHCTLQMGGDDQWSNMLGGMELVRRLGNGKSFCLTFPLLVTSDGKKMGKTEKGAFWLDEALTTPYEYFQFWRNVEDAKVKECLSFFTDLSMSEINRLSALEGAKINDAKVALAFEATKLLHGEEAALKAKEAAAALVAHLHGGGAADGHCDQRVHTSVASVHLHLHEASVDNVYNARSRDARLRDVGGNNHFTNVSRRALEHRHLPVVRHGRVYGNGGQ